MQLELVEHRLPYLPELARPGDEFDESEALAYALFPFHVMVGLHFKAEAIAQGEALVAAVASRSSHQSTDTVSDRLREYAAALFDGTAMRRGRLEVAENGLHYLARAACRRILGRDVCDIATLYQAGASWSSVFVAWKGGARLKDLFDTYPRDGPDDTEWVNAVRAAHNTDGAA